MQTQIKSTSKSPLFATLLLGVALLIYMAIRAVKVGFTHDESSSFMNLIHEPVKDVFFNERNWQAANNHLINTFCMQLGYHFFGAAEWALRWGSVVAGLIFVVYVFRTIKLWLPVASWWFFSAFCIFVLNHFIIDFFSLARGYGLCVAFEMAALYYFFRWIKQKKSSDLLKSGAALGVGILSNFVLLDFMAAFFLTVTIVFYVENKNNLSFTKWLQLIILPALPILITILLIFQPMRWISAKGEFEYGPQGFWETWRVLVERFMYHPSADYSWVKVVVLVVATLLFLGLGYTIFKRFKTAGIDSHPVLFYATLLTVFTMLMTTIQHYLVGANYLIGRTAILFYPLLSAVVALYLIDLKSNTSNAHVKWKLVTAFIIINFCSQLNLRFALEWPYDENTKAATIFVNQQGDTTHKITYGVGWLYYSTTMFYQETLGLNHLQLVHNINHDDLSWITSQPFDFIYVGEELQPKIGHRYAVFKAYPQGLVMKRK